MIIRSYEGPRKGTLIEYSCDTCGKIQTSVRKIFLKRSEHYCSRECAYSSKVRSQKLSKALSGRPGHPCSDEQRRKQSLALKGRKLSPECREKATTVLRSFPQKGIKRSEETKRKISENHAWRGKVVPWFEPWMTSGRALWRNEIKRKFDSTCLICFSKEEIETHHIVPVCESPERELDLNNGMCLCYSCHKFVHEVLRRNNNEYIEMISYLKGSDS